MASEQNSISVVFQADISDLQKALNQAGQILQSNAKKMQEIGQSMSTFLTAPIALFGASVLKTAGDFESSMNTVRAVSGVTAEEFDILNKKAKQLGATTQFSAKEAADAMGELAKNGLNFNQIMSGALDASLSLAAATKTDLANAANIATDAMLQFGASASELPGIIDKIAGLTVASKFGIQDVALALANAGGVAGSMKIPFEQFATAIAATSSLFSSGADAGTSFKTFLQRLSPQTKDAKDMMAKLNLTFFDSQGKMDSLSTISEKLKNATKNLSDEQKQNALNTIFGSDAIRTAIALANQGAEGFDKLGQAIGKVSAADLAKIQMEGFNGAIKGLSSAFEALQLAIAGSGLLEFFTGLINSTTTVLQKLSTLNPAILKFGSILAGLLATLGPVLFAVGKLSTALPILFASVSKGAMVFVNFGKAVAAASAPVLLLALKIGAVIAVLVAVGVALKSAYDSFEGFRQIVDLVRTKALEFWDLIVKYAGVAAQEIKKFIGFISGMFAKLFGGSDEGNRFKKVAEDVSKVTPEIKALKGEVSFGDAFKKNLSELGNFVTNGLGSLKNGLNDLLFVKGEALNFTDNTTPTKKAVDDLNTSVNSLSDSLEKTKKAGQGFNLSEFVLQLQKDLKVADDSFAVLGGSMSELANNKISILKQGITTLLQNGFAPTSQEVMNLKTQLKGLQGINLEEFTTNLSKQLALVDSKAQVFGTSLANIAQEKITILKESINSLLEAGFSPTSEAIINLNNQLATQQALFAQTTSSIALARDEISKMLQTMQDGQFTFDKFGNALATVFSQLGQDVANGQKDFKEFATSVVASIKRVISGLIAQGIAAAVTNTLASAGVTGPFAVIIAGAAGAAAAALFNSIIPKFADGGLVYGPTLGMVGEYPGASANPEVIAPLSDLKGILASTAPSFNVDAIVNAIKSNPPTSINIDSRGFAEYQEARQAQIRYIDERFSWRSK